MPIVPDPRELPTFEPTDDVVAMLALKDEVRSSPALLLIYRYAEAARDMGMDTEDPRVMRRIVDGAHAAYEREVEYEARRAGFRALEAARRAGERHPHLVYYMLQGGLVKIGLTVNIKKRYRNLTPEAVLAVEPGADVVEKARHGEFAGLRSHGEWFRYEAPLRAHIDAVRAQFAAEVGMPMDRWLKLVGVPVRAALAD
jgi:T5orf172 domain